MHHLDIFSVAILKPVLNYKLLDQYIFSTEFCFSVQNSQQLKNSLHALNSSEDSSFNYINSFELSKLSIQDSYDTKETEYAYNFCSCILNLSNNKPAYKVKLKCDILLYSILLNELKKSKAFRCNVMKNFYKIAKKHSKISPKKSKQCLLCNKVIFYFQISILLSALEKNIIDYKWNKKLEVIINERCELENAMAWLSTLGGAFSALGDYFLNCAEKAGLISMHQLRIALRLGDPITICQCKIYLAMSLIQRGYYTKAKDLMRELYLFSVGSEGSKDFRLKNMCIAVWNKLKYVLSEKRKRRQEHQKCLI